MPRLDGSAPGLNTDQNDNLYVTTANAIWVNDFTVPTGQTMYVASGEELAFGNLTINGTMIVAGTVKSAGVTYGTGGSLLLENGASMEFLTQL